VGAAGCEAGRTGFTRRFTPNDFRVQPARGPALDRDREGMV